jgi:hypothetical protein
VNLSNQTKQPVSAAASPPPPPILRLPAGFGVCWLCNGAGATWRGQCPKCGRTGIVKVAA